VLEKVNIMELKSRTEEVYGVRNFFQKGLLGDEHGFFLDTNIIGKVVFHVKVVETEEPADNRTKGVNWGDKTQDMKGPGLKNCPTGNQSSLSELREVQRDRRPITTDVDLQGVARDLHCGFLVATSATELGATEGGTGIDEGKKGTVKCYWLKRP